MKQTKTIILLLILMTFFSCSNDDSKNDTSTTNHELIIGTWRWTAITENGVESVLSECEKLETFKYNGNEVEITIYLDFDIECRKSSTIENYSITENLITFSDKNDSSDSYTLEIIKLTSTTLQFRQEVNHDSKNFIYIYTYTKVK